MPGISEVSLKELADIEEKLDRDRVVEPHDFAQLCDVFGGGMGGAQDHQRRVPGEDPGQNKHDDEGPEESRDSREDTAQKILPEAHAMETPIIKHQITNNFQ